MIYLHTYSFREMNKKEQKEQSRKILLTNIGNYLEINNNEVQLNTNKNGKPSVDGLFFSVSHSHDKLVQAFTFLGDIGLDIEFKNTKRKFLNLANKYFHKQESSYLSSLNAIDAMHAFYALWTTKEAICKEQGGRLWYYLGYNCLNEKNKMISSFNGLNIIQIKTFSNFSMSIATEFNNVSVVSYHE
jgi:4'-phosphopantetheinyl transferase